MINRTCRNLSADFTGPLMLPQFLTRAKEFSGVVMRGGFGVSLAAAFSHRTILDSSNLKVYGAGLQVPQFPMILRGSAHDPENPWVWPAASRKIIYRSIVKPVFAAAVGKQWSPLKSGYTDTSLWFTARRLLERNCELATRPWRPSKLIVSGFWFGYFTRKR